MAGQSPLIWHIWHLWHCDSSAHNHLSIFDSMKVTSRPGQHLPSMSRYQLQRVLLILFCSYQKPSHWELSFHVLTYLSSEKILTLMQTSLQHIPAPSGLLPFSQKAMDAGLVLPLLSSIVIGSGTFLIPAMGAASMRLADQCL